MYHVLIYLHVYCEYVTHYLNASHFQVSQLVILHEEAERGRIVSDLVQPVAAVKAAVDNLVVVSGSM